MGGRGGRKGRWRSTRWTPMRGWPGRQARFVCEGSRARPPSARLHLEISIAQYEVVRKLHRWEVQPVRLVRPGRISSFYLNGVFQSISPLVAGVLLGRGVGVGIGYSAAGAPCGDVRVQMCLQRGSRGITLAGFAPVFQRMWFRGKWVIWTKRLSGWGIALFSDPKVYFGGTRAPAFCYGGAFSIRMASVPFVGDYPFPYRLSRPAEFPTKSGGYRLLIWGEWRASRPHRRPLIITQESQRRQTKLYRATLPYNVKIPKYGPPRAKSEIPVAEKAADVSVARALKSNTSRLLHI